jgi:hypothetical protein
MAFPYVSRKKFNEVVEIAEKRLFEVQHLILEKKHSENFLREEIISQEKAIERILENIGKFKQKTSIEYFNSTSDEEEIGRVREIFNKWGTDKSTKHQYEVIYAELKKDLPARPRILEIGCGSNNPNIRHAMSPKYLPLSSLFALQEIFDSHNIEGADIDESLKNQTKFKISTIDQFNKDSLCETVSKSKVIYDLIIDDGVHDISANYLTLVQFFKLLRPGGKYVIEDVSLNLVESWRFLLQDLGIIEMRIYLPKNQLELTTSTYPECAIILYKDLHQ